MKSILTSHTKMPENIGGKARNLVELQRLGINTAPFVVIPYTVFESLANANTSFRIEQPNFETLKLPDTLLNEIATALDTTKFFAVRSSYHLEDSEDHSFAGQFKTKLYVPFEKLHAAILDVLASVLNPQLIEYQKKHSLPPFYFLSVVLQEMVDSEVSGVAFGVNPVTGNRREKIINAVYGLGEGLVSGKLNADTYSLSDDGIHETIVPKTKAYTFNKKEEHGITLSTTPEENSLLPTLTHQQVATIGNTLDKLKQHFGKYQDIEFALEKDQLFILQTRPVTSLANTSDTSGKYIVWDNSNIIESYPGITLPLTYSFILKLYEQAYRQFVALMGVSDKEINRHADHFSNMLGFLNGRIYYNLRSWYQMIAMLPGYSFNARFMEQMMGVKERFDVDLPEKTGKLRASINLMRMIISILRNLFTLEKQKKQFVSFFNSMEEEFKQTDTDQLDAHELYTLYRKQEALLVGNWKAPLVNDFFAMIYFGVLKKQMAQLFGENTNLHNDLLFGVQTIITTKPAEIINDMVNDIFDSPEALKLFNEKSATSLLKQLPHHQSLSQLHEKFTRYIEQFGDRQVGELKLETKTYRLHPELLIGVLQSYVHYNKRSSINYSGKDNHLRELAEKQVKKRLKRKPFKRLLLNHVIHKVRALVSGRENLRLYRTKAFGFSRQAFISLGKLFYAENIIEQRDDIFLLTKEEIFDYIKGTSVNYNLKALIALRKNQFEGYKTEEVQSERIQTHGMVYLGNTFRAKEILIDSSAQLKGIGCCKGIVKGKVRIVHRPEEAFNIEGDILVTTSTDPGWVTIFPSISGILVERGSLLSHAAIVSREMGIPCIVGISNLTHTLKSGDYVEMDGELGIVNVVNHRDHE